MSNSIIPNLGMGVVGDELVRAIANSIEVNGTGINAADISTSSGASLEDIESLLQSLLVRVHELEQKLYDLENRI